ncbi:carbohydrate ABC transporter permease [Tessaracoccus palaemonis]|uniref:Carbohydrate ABC transporter permease n=1 Tax=Tessaracoccus palaemonis TaxID=2829499 RepID=A0ABX8SG53_9ACTN|nr:carbohydrate ABC transporter permease [Tessaracoccus palaemonis]QXT62356.1 carbohydrate ABC transporter permease [Tessaracoccus palaemonis]
MTTATLTAPAHAAPARTASRRKRFNPLVWLVILIVAGFSLGPVLYAILGGFRTNAQLAADPAGMPDPWVWDNYARVLADGRFWTYGLNSLAIALLTTALVVICGLMAAYPLSRYRFRGREALYMVFVLGLLFPATVAVIPLFIIISRDLGMSNTWFGVALPQAAFALPMTIVILRPFLQQIPAEIEEAASIDGAGRITVFWRMMLPLSGPGLVTVGVLAFVNSWNAYLLPLLLLQGDMRTLPLGVADYSTQYSSDTAGVFAFTSLSMVPAMIFFLAMQRRIVGGLSGAVKG